MIGYLVFFIFAIGAFSEELSWRTMDEALTLSKSSGSPILLLSVRKNCKPCKKLLEQFETSTEFGEESKKYILAKAEDADISKLGKYTGKGKYVPKVTFVNTHGVFMSELDNKNKKKEETKYFYKKVEDVLESMKVGLEHQYLDDGFGRDYIWHDWEVGLATAKEQNKPILVIFHQGWCGACKRLKPLFAKSAEVKELASNFIMINTDIEEVVTSDKYKVDGEYYPKILFLESDGELMDKELNYGTRHKHVLHYYGDGVEVSKSMERVLGNITEMKNIEDNGFGKHIKWVKYPTGLQIAKEKKKPMMLIITKTYCGACKALKPKIRHDEEFAELSKQFVMVNVQDDDEPDEDQFDQDGAYIPRIFFLDSNGKVETTIFNEAKSFKKSRFAYSTPKQIIGVMKKALEMKLGDRVVEDVKQEVKETKSQNATLQEETKKEETQKEEVEKQQAQQPNDGFDTNIKWYSYTDGVQEVKKRHKIGLVLFYNNYCVFSKFMKEQFNDSPQVTELSEKFVMIRVSEEETKKLELGDKYDGDGKYTPRLFFIDPDENVHNDLNNTGTQYDQTMFYYGTAGEIVKSMKRAIDKINVTLGRGFGEYIQWVKYERALEVAKEKRMPMMLIIHKTWCGACHALKPKIRESRDIWELSKYFVMSNVEDAEEPVDTAYFVDGGYYPRIYFLDSTGKVHHDLHNRDPAFLKYKYSYAYEDQLLHTMKFAIGKFYPSQENEQQTNEQTDSTTTTTTTEETTTSSTTTTTTTTEKMLSPGKKLLAKMDVKWTTITDAMEEAKASNKPIMFLIHRTTCPACKATIKLISRDEKFKENSSPFILADIEDDVDDELADSFDVDGTYVPRIYFLDPEGKIFKDIWNVGTNYLDNKFYFFEISSIHRAMEKAKRKMETWSPGSNNSEAAKKDEKENETNTTPVKEEEKMNKKEEL